MTGGGGDIRSVDKNFKFHLFGSVYDRINYVDLTSYLFIHSLIFHNDRFIF